MSYYPGSFLIIKGAFHTAEYPLKNSAILDSGTIIHVFNQISRFVSYIWLWPAISSGPENTLSAFRVRRRGYSDSGATRTKVATLTKTALFTATECSLLPWIYL